MAKLLVSLLCAVIIGTQAANAQESWNCRNAIGVFSAEIPTPSTVRGAAFYDGPPGGFEVYVVCLNPWNENPETGDVRPITEIGGFEFRLGLPANVFLLNAVLPPAGINFGTPPEFYCGCAAPVTPDGTSVLVTLSLFETNGTAGTISIGPLTSVAPTFPDELAIVDRSDFAANTAQSVAGDYALPVFGIYTAEVLAASPCLPAAPVTGGDGTPQVAALTGNVPNPFNPSTALEFELPRATRVDLEIFDAAGRRVRWLVVGESYPAGRHAVVWSGRDDSGRAVASGAYISRLRADGEVSTGRLLLLR